MFGDFHRLSSSSLGGKAAVAASGPAGKRAKTKSRTERLLDFGHAIRFILFLPFSLLTETRFGSS